MESQNSVQLRHGKTPRLPWRHRRLRGSCVLALALLCWNVQAGGISCNVQGVFELLEFQKFLFPTLALCGGLILHALGVGEAAILMVYCGAQAGMNLYMKSVLSETMVDEKLQGIPIGFLLTSIQQFVAFAAFAAFVLFSHLAGRGYKPKPLRTAKEVLMVIGFSMAFAVNIGLNNFSLSLLAISVNVIIRACLPLATAVTDVAVKACMGHGCRSPISKWQWVLMVLGVISAAVASYSKKPPQGESEDFVLGLCSGVGSLFAAALNMVLAGVLCSRLNSVDTTCYMALPAGLTMLLPALYTTHAVTKWPGLEPMTDWEVFQEVWERNSWALVPVFLSGFLAFGYNVLQYYLVSQLSATHVSFAGNFNTAATIVVSLLVGIDSLPEWPRGLVFLLAILVNIAAFSGFTALKT